MSDLRSKLEDAISKKENNINNYEWLYFDDNGNKQTIKLIDATDDQLNQFIVHCDVMLNNEDDNKPGRYMVKAKLDDLKNKLGSEIFLKEIEANGITRSSIIEAVNDGGYSSDSPAGDIFNNISPEFKSIPVSYIIQAASQQAGIPYFKQFTKALFYKAGVWVGRDELKTLQRNYQQMKTVPAIREELQLPANVMIGINPETGLSLKEMKLALTLRGNNTRFHEFELEDLSIIKNKLLPIVYDTIMTHIEQWLNRRKKIQEVIIQRIKD